MDYQSASTYGSNALENKIDWCRTLAADNLAVDVIYRDPTTAVVRYRPPTHHIRQYSRFADIFWCIITCGLWFIVMLLRGQTYTSSKMSAPSHPYGLDIITATPTGGLTVRTAPLSHERKILHDLTPTGD